MSQSYNRRKKNKKLSKRTTSEKNSALQAYMLLNLCAPEEQPSETTTVQFL